MSTMQITELCGRIPFTVRIVRRGDRYGLDDKLVHERNDPLIEFYDRRHMHTEYGQFISRYNLADYKMRDADVGLNLDGAVPDWSLTAPTMRIVENWILNETEYPLKSSY